MSDPKALVPRLLVSKCCILKKMKFEIEKTVANIFLCHSALHAVLFHMLVLWVSQAYMCLGIEAYVGLHSVRGGCWRGINGC